MHQRTRWLKRMLAAGWLAAVTSFVLTLPAHASALLAESDSADASSWGPLALLALGPAVYALIYAFYRNPAARHKYETETDVKTDHLEQSDQFAERRQGTRHSTMPGSNSHTLLGNPLNNRSGLLSTLIDK